MTIHYHGLPITPNRVLETMAGKHFCVSFAHPQQVKRAHEIGQSVMLDNGAFTAWKSGKHMSFEWWRAYYDWTATWFEHPNTWAVIPDVIDAGSQEQDALLREWPHGHRGAPVWHMDEHLDRLVDLTLNWPRVCIGSTAEYRTVGSDMWRARMDNALSRVAAKHRWMPPLHMLRGMQCVEWRYLFASVDSTDVARNHHCAGKVARVMADRWDSQQIAAPWSPAMAQLDFFEEQAA